jgi:hypothetical protein
MTAAPLAQQILALLPMLCAYSGTQTFIRFLVGSTNYARRHPWFGKLDNLLLSVAPKARSHFQPGASPQDSIIRERSAESAIQRSIQT